MSNTSLYIIGNGFDLHHGIKSSYSNFKTYIKGADNPLFELVETYLSPDENWSDLEMSLASLDIDYIIENASDFLMSYSAEKWSDSYHHNYQFEISQIVDSLSSRLKEKFADWLTQLQIPSKYEVDKLLQIDKDAMYLSFNYTDTLEKIYSIEESKISFIHGSVKQNKSDIILGHAWNPVVNPPLIDEADPELLDTRVLEGNEIIKHYFQETFKPAMKIIESNKMFFESLSEISHIYILGHSLSIVDIEYFQAIAECIDTDKVQWKISYYDPSKLKNYKQTIEKLGIDIANIDFILLQDLSIKETT